jgi:phage gpG-like protein
MISSNDACTVNVKPLEQILKALKARPPVTRVGILGEKTTRHQGGKKHSPTNAQIGAAHEYGAPEAGIPQRSFLRVPISDHLEEELEHAGAFGEDVLKEVVRTGNLIPFMKKVATVAEGIVAGAFETAGYGLWKKWKRKGYHNNANMLLVDTNQLRESIASEVKE